MCRHPMAAGLGPCVCAVFDFVLANFTVFTFVFFFGWLNPKVWWAFSVRKQRPSQYWIGSSVAIIGKLVLIKCPERKRLIRSVGKLAFHSLNVTRFICTVVSNGMNFSRVWYIRMAVDFFLRFAYFIRTIYIQCSLSFTVCDSHNILYRTANM